MLPNTHAHRRRRGKKITNILWNITTQTSCNFPPLFPSGLRLFSRPRERQACLSDATHSTHTWQHTTERPVTDSAQTVEPPAEDTLANSQLHGETSAADVCCCCICCSGCCICGLFHTVDGCYCRAGMWDAKPEDQEQNEAVFKVQSLQMTDWLMTHDS